MSGARAEPPPSPRPTREDATVAAENPEPRDPGVGLYLHVPFCERICPYCDFAVVAGVPGHREARTVAALETEIAARADAFAPARLATVYFGGGTPSLLRPESVQALLAAARRAFPGTPEETTLEVNPGTTERARLSAFRAAGIDRLSIGIQSFDDDALKRLGRAHRAAAGHTTLAAARQAGFRNLSLDLIFGVPGQTLAAVEADVARALDHGPEHVSAYALTVEPGTPLAAAVARGRVRMPDDDAVADMMEAVAAALEAGGLRRYEVSSYARPGREARHNRRYWLREPVLGVGVGAASYLPPPLAPPHGARPANERDFAGWAARVAAGRADRPPEPGRLTASEARSEAVFLALRRREGLSAAGFAAEHGAPPRHWYRTAICSLVAAGLLAESGAGDLALTHRGWLLSDSVFEAFVGG